MYFKVKLYFERALFKSLGLLKPVMIPQKVWLTEEDCYYFTNPSFFHLADDSTANK